jgi:hypothetical protein
MPSKIEGVIIVAERGYMFLSKVDKYGARERVDLRDP